MDEGQLIEFGLSLYARLGEAVRLRRVKCNIGAWEPQPHYCHDNVKAWVEHNPQHKHVYGFVYFDISLLGYVEFAAHSAVELENGTLVDITPHNASQDYPFLRHTGTFDEFAAVAERIKLQVPIQKLPS
jgi:hypothetical protein